MSCAGGCGCGGSCAVSAPPDSAVALATLPTSSATIPPGCKCVCECLPRPAKGGGPSKRSSPLEEAPRVLVPGPTGSGNVPDPAPRGGPRDDEALVAPLSPGGQGGTGSFWRPEPLTPGVRLGPGPATAPPRTTTDGGSGNITMARRASPRERPLQRLDASMPFAASPWRPAGSGTMQDSVRGTATVDASQAVAVAFPLPSLDASDAPGVPAVAGRLSTLPPAGALVPRDTLRDGVNPVFRALAPISPLATGAARRAGAAFGPHVSLRPEPFNDTDPDTRRRRRGAVATSADGSGALRDPASARRPGTRVPDLVSIADTPSSAAHFVTNGIPEDTIPDVAHAQATTPVRSQASAPIGPGFAVNATAALAPGADLSAVRPPLHQGTTAASIGQPDPVAPQGAATHIAIGVTAGPPRAGVSRTEAGAAVRAPEGSGAAVGRGTGYDPAAAPRGPGPGLGDATGLGIPTLNALRHGGKGGGGLLAAAAAARHEADRAWRAYLEAPVGRTDAERYAWEAARGRDFAAYGAVATGLSDLQAMIMAERRIKEAAERLQHADERQSAIDAKTRYSGETADNRRVKETARDVRDAATRNRASLTALHGKGDPKLNNAARKAADEAKKLAKTADDLAKKAERARKYGSRHDASDAAIAAWAAAEDAKLARNDAEAALLAAYAAAGLPPPEMILSNGVRLPLREGWDFGLPPWEKQRVLELICGSLSICLSSCACTGDEHCVCHWDYQPLGGGGAGGMKNLVMPLGGTQFGGSLRWFAPLDVQVSPVNQLGGLEDWWNDLKKTWSDGTNPPKEVKSTLGNSLRELRKAIAAMLRQLSKMIRFAPNPTAKKALQVIRGVLRGIDRACEGMSRGSDLVTGLVMVRLNAINATLQVIGAVMVGLPIATARSAVFYVNEQLGVPLRMTLWALGVPRGRAEKISALLQYGFMSTVGAKVLQDTQLMKTVLEGIGSFVADVLEFTGKIDPFRAPLMAGLRYLRDHGKISADDYKAIKGIDDLIRQLGLVVATDGVLRWARGKAFGGGVTAPRRALPESTPGATGSVVDESAAPVTAVPDHARGSVPDPKAPRTEVGRGPQVDEQGASSGARSGYEAGGGRITPKNAEALDSAMQRASDLAAKQRTTSGFRVSIETPEGTRIKVDGDPFVDHETGRLVIDDVSMIEDGPMRTHNQGRLLDDAGEYMGQQARKLGYTGVEFRGLRIAGATGKQGGDMIRIYPRVR